MKIMKGMLIGFIIINLAAQGFLSSVSASDMTGGLDNVSLNPGVDHLLKQPGSDGFSLKAKRLTVNEQVFLKAMEVKTRGLLDQSAGAFYDDKYEKPPEPGPSSFVENNPKAVGVIGGAVVGAFFGWLISSAAEDPKRSAQTGALFGAAVVVLLSLI